VDTWWQITIRSAWGQRHKRSSSVSSQLCNITARVYHCPLVTVDTQLLAYPHVQTEP
jgi:hypothetical protein